MKRLYVLGSILAIVACTPQPPPPAAPAPPPPLAAAPPPAPITPPPAGPAGMSFDGAYAGSMVASASGLSGDNRNRSGCVQERPARMTIRNSAVFIRYSDWKRHRLHYRGKVDANGVVTAYHTNRDGSSSIISGQLSNNQLVGNMMRGPCDYTVTLAKR
jgi:hypothetical protein